MEKAAKAYNDTFKGIAELKQFAIEVEKCMLIVITDRGIRDQKKAIDEREITNTLRRNFMKQEAILSELCAELEDALFDWRLAVKHDMENKVSVEELV